MLSGSLGSSAGLGASGAELGASGVCFPLESTYSKNLTCILKLTSLGASDTGLGASDVELGATDLDFAVEGSTFPKIQ